MVKNKEAILLLFSVFLVTVIFALIAIIAFFPNKNTQTQRESLPNGASNADPLAPTSQEDIIKMGQSYKVGELINLLPYNGKNFSFYYSFENNSFTLYLNPDNKTAANKEFDDFIKKNGIDSRTWFETLNITYTVITPNP